MNIDLELNKLFCNVVFYTVAKTKDMTKASEVLHISQPTISQSIKKLEEQLGGTLFSRNNKDMELTSEGKIFYENLKGTFALINNAEFHDDNVNNFEDPNNISRFYRSVEQEFRNDDSFDMNGGHHMSSGFSTHIPICKERKMSEKERKRQLKVYGKKL